MNSSIRKIAVFALITVTMAGTILAAPFEELFQLKGISGKCYVKKATDSKFVKAEQNKAYLYGTAVKTDKKGTATIFFSKNNTCILKANTSVIVSEEKANKKNKIITINTGNISVDLDEEFHKTNGLKIITATGICKAIGCRFKVEQSSKTDMDSSNYDCAKGKIGVSGADFDVPELDDHDELGVTEAKDNSFTRLEVIKGDMNIVVKNAKAEPETKKATKGSVIKIWREASGSGKTKTVTMLITNPEGALEEAITYTEAVKQALPKVAAVAVPVAVAEAAKDKKDPASKKKEPKKDKPKKDDDSKMQDTADLLDHPPLVGLSSARGDAAVQAEIDAMKVPLPAPTKKKSPTPVGGR